MVLLSLPTGISFEGLGMALLFEKIVDADLNIERDKPCKKLGPISLIGNKTRIFQVVC